MNQAEDSGSFKMHVRGVASFLHLFCLTNAPPTLQIATIPRQDPTLEIVGNWDGAAGSGFRQKGGLGGSCRTGEPGLPFWSRARGRCRLGRRVQLEAAGTGFIFRWGRWLPTQCDFTGSGAPSKPENTSSTCSLVPAVSLIRTAFCF